MTTNPKPKPNADARPATKRGKPTNLYLRTTDVDRVRDLTAFVAGQGERTSDSLVVRAALRLAKPDRAFMNAYREVASADLRFKTE